MDVAPECTPLPDCMTAGQPRHSVRSPMHHAALLQADSVRWFTI